MKNHYPQLSQAFIGLLLLSGIPAFAAKADVDDIKSGLSKPYVTVNGVAQPSARAEILLREQIARGAQDNQQLRDGVRDVLVNQALMEQEARKVGLDKDVLVRAQMDIARQNILAQAWQQKILGDITIKNEDLKAEYDRQVARLGDKEYLIRHLVVADESTAKLLIEKLQAGGKMADLAKEYSRDQGTKEKGGLNDWIPQGNLLPALAKVIKTLSKGNVALQPIKTDANWHVVQLEDSRPYKAPTLEELKPQLNQIIARRELEERVKALRDKAKIQ